MFQTDLQREELVSKVACLQQYKSSIYFVFIIYVTGRITKTTDQCMKIIKYENMK